MTFSLIIAEVAVANLIRYSLTDDPPDFKEAHRYLKVFTSSSIILSMYIFSLVEDTTTNQFVNSCSSVLLPAIKLILSANLRLLIFLTPIDNVEVCS